MKIFANKCYICGYVFTSDTETAMVCPRCMKKGFWQVYKEPKKT